MNTKQLKNEKIATWLPVFNGFYNTIWQFQDDNLLYNINDDRKQKGLMPIEWDTLNIDYKKYEFDIALSVIEVLRDKLSNYVENIEFENIISPKEYNFKNDSIDCIIIPKIDNIRDFIYDNIELFKEYLKVKYTSYDGFISHYANDFESWENYTQDFTDYSGSGHYLGSILQFICEILNISEYSIYESVKYESDVYEDNYLTNYNECINSLVCYKCDKIIKDDDTIKQVEKYKNMMGFFPKKINCKDCID